MIKAVVFDFGGVLSRFGARGDNTHRIAATLGCDPRLAYTQLVGLEVNWMRGKVETPEFWKTAAELVGAPEADYETKWTLNEPRNYETSYYDFAESLRHEGYVTAVFSNINPASAALVRNAGGYRGFSPVVNSCEIGACKPEPAAFEKLLKVLGLPASEVLLVDDLEENVDVARSIGMVAVRATDPRSTQKQVLIELVRPMAVKKT